MLRYIAVLVLLMTTLPTYCQPPFYGPMGPYYPGSMYGPMMPPPMGPPPPFMGPGMYHYGGPGMYPYGYNPVRGAVRGALVGGLIGALSGGR